MFLQVLTTDLHDFIVAVLLHSLHVMLRGGNLRRLQSRAYL